MDLINQGENLDVSVLIHSVFLDGQQVSMVQAAIDRRIILSYHIGSKELRYRKPADKDSTLIATVTSGAVTSLKTLNVPINVYA